MVLHWSFLLLFVVGAWSQQDTISVLTSLFNSTNGDNWLNNTNWLDGDPCDPNAGWYGISCSNDEVTVIDLTGNGLAGSLPEDLNNLTSLQILSLGYNNGLTGTIPNLSGLVNLQGVYLNNSDISGKYPEWFTQLPSLNTISLSNCSKIGGDFPVSWCSITQLQLLSLGGQEMTGTLPDCIGNWTNLQYFEIFSTKLTGSIPNSLVKMTALQFLEFNYNQLSGTIPQDIGNLTALQRFTVYDNQLQGTLPASIGKLTNLIEIHFRNNSLTGTIPDEMQNMAKIANIGLESNYINGSIPEWLSPETMFNLQNLDLRCNNLNGPLPTWLRSDPAGEYVINVWFGCNNISESDLPSWCIGQHRCGANACDGSRCMLKGTPGPNRVVVIALIGFLSILVLGNVALILVLLRKRCRPKSEPHAELDGLIKNEYQ